MGSNIHAYTNKPTARSQCYVVWLLTSSIWYPHQGDLGTCGNNE